MMRLASKVLLLWLMVSLPAGAEQSVRDDGIVIHYSAMTTADLTPDIAKALDVTRSRKRALVVIHAQHLDGANRVSKLADVQGRTRNLVSQRRELRFRAVKDGGTDYAIAVVPVANLETLIFDLEVRVEGHTRAVPIQFRQQFYH